MNIYTALLKPERLGVSGSMWLIIFDGEYYIVGLKKFEELLASFLSDPTNVNVTISTDHAKQFLERIIHG